MANQNEPGGEGNRDAQFQAYFECFNASRFYEAHEALERVWLPRRKGPDGSFYKGLIQLAGAFVHFQKGRLGPATALLRLAQENLEHYPPVHEKVALRQTLATIGACLSRWERAGSAGVPALMDVRREQFPQFVLRDGQFACE